MVATPGSSAGLQLAFVAAFEPGERVAPAAHGYPDYRNILTALGLEAVLIEVGENAHYHPNPELLAEARPRAGLIVPTPAPPPAPPIRTARLCRLPHNFRDPRSRPSARCLAPRARHAA